MDVVFRAGTTSATPMSAIPSAQQGGLNGASAFRVMRSDEQRQQLPVRGKIDDLGPRTPRLLPLLPSQHLSLPAL